MLPINQLGSPAGLEQLGFFVNKGASHIRERVNLSLKRSFIHFVVALSQSSKDIESAFHVLPSYFLVAGSSHRHPEKGKPLSFFSPPSPAPFQGERRAFDESPPCSRRAPDCVSSSSSSVSDGSDRGDTCPEPPLTERERKKERGGGREAHCLMGETHSEATNLQRLSLIVTGQEVPCY